ncbi:MAG: ribosome biosis GTPase / thiamine phosphate phosphatase [Frankiaceae bacterium]|nr:ribosome biosis GTPase / thiamine phosphate phosphatase [Frankiaceae bacterium]
MAVDAVRRRPLSRQPRDAEDSFGRAGRGSRPRSRLRPEHGDATSARVVTVDRGRYGCLLEDGTILVAMRARELGRRSVVVGDEVAVVGDVTGAADTLSRIVRVEKRRSVLRRTADDDDPVERIIVANADQLVVVCSVADPPPQPRLVDRCLVAAIDAGVEPLLCVTKTDLAPPEHLLEIYRSAGVQIVTSSAETRDAAVATLTERLRARVTVFVGTSGVGKSTLVNALVPDATQRIGTVSLATGKGLHTTTAAIALPLPFGGWVVDTPGVRSFGLAHVDRDRLVACFPDLAPGTDECPSDCDHLDPQVCCLDEWVSSGHAHPERLDSLRRLLVSRSAD